MFGKKKNTTEDSAASTEAVETTETPETVEVAATTETETTEATSSDEATTTTVPEEVLAATAAAIGETTETMTVSSEDMELLNRYRLAGEDCVKELGNIEIRKARIIASYGQLENASQAKLMEIGQGLGLSEGVGWSVNPDGTVTVHNTPETAATGEVTTSAE